MRWTSILLLMLFLGCGDRQPIAPSSPTQAGPVVPSGPRMALSGTVFERISGRPIEGADVSVRPLKIPAYAHGLERGVRNITILKLLQIAKALNVRMTTFFEG